MSNRIAFTAVRVGQDAMRGSRSLLADMDGVACIPIRRAFINSVLPTLGTLLTGVSATRHQIHTLKVPRVQTADEDAVDQDRPPLMYRTSRMSGAPMVWNRLAARGIQSLVVNMPFNPARDDEQVVEVPQLAVVKRAKEEEISVARASLGFILGSVTNRPDIRCVITGASFLDDQADPAGETDLEEEDSEDQDVEHTTASDENEEDSKAELTESEREAGREVVQYLDDLARASGAEHVLVALMGNRMGAMVLIGPRANEVNKTFVRSIAFVPTLLDLLGESSPVDVLGATALSGKDDDKQEATSSWSLDGGETDLPDWSAVIQRVRDGEAADSERVTLVRHLFSAVNSSMYESNGGNIIDEVGLLDELVQSPVSSLRLALIQNMTGDQEKAREQIRKLGEEHPDSLQADMGCLLGAWSLDPEGIEEILDRHPPESTTGSLEKGIRARAAARAGRDDEAIGMLWGLVLQGRALNQDRLILAKLAMKRNEPKSARMAALVLRDMGSPGATKPNGEPRSDVLMLRARALAQSGSRPMAKHLLEVHLGRHPGDQKVSALLAAMNEQE